MNGLDFSALTSPQWIILIVAVIWSFFWKGAALWHAARKKQGLWFTVILFVNTLGILEIIYLFGVEKVKSDKLYK